MDKTTASKTPSPGKNAVQPAATPAGSKVSKNSKTAENYRRDFLMAAMNMSWQLAIVVLVPVIGGFELDKKFNTLPALTIAGFFIAMTGMGLVVWRQLQLFSPGIDGKGGRS